LVMSCSDDPIGKSEATFVQANAKGKPDYVTYDSLQTILNTLKQDFGSTIFTGGQANGNVSIDGNWFDMNISKYYNWNIDVPYLDRKVYYDRLETYGDDFTGIKFLREINDRDWQISMYGNGASTYGWMDANSATDNNNWLLSAGGFQSYSQIWFTQKWMKFNQSNGVYIFPHIKQFNSEANFISYLNTLDEAPSGVKIYMDENGFIKGTQEVSTARKSTDEFRGYPKKKDYPKYSKQ